MDQSFTPSMLMNSQEWPSGVCYASVSKGLHGGNSALCSRRACIIDSQKAARAAQNPAQNPVYCAENPGFALKSGLGAQKGPKIFFRPCGRKKIGAAQKRSETQPGKTGVKTGGFPP